MNYKLYIIAAILTGLFKVQGQDIASNKDTITIPEILVTSNRIHMSPMLAPNKIQVMSEKYISKLNGDKLSDVLTNSDAAFIKDYGFNSGMKTISLNATQSEHALILLNGVKLNSPENAQFDAALLQMNDVNRIEISNGGSSSLYGSEAIGGIINIVSNDFLYQKAFNIDISNTIGSYGFNKLYVGTGSSLIFSGNKLLNLRVSYSNENSKNNYQYYSFNGFSNELKERFNNDYRANTFNLDAAYTLSRTSSIRLFSLYSSWNRGVPGPDFGFSSAEARQIDNNLVSSISFNKTFFGDKEIKTSLNYKYSLMKYYDPLTYNTSSPINDFYKINSIINNSEINLFKNTKHEVTSGYELSYNNLLSNEVDKSKETQIGIYSAAKLEINKLLDKIIFYPSVRYDYFSDINKNVFTGKIGLNLKPFRKANFTLKSSISNNFRAPTFNELYWIGLGNKNLQPEKSTSFDAGFYYGFKLLSDNLFEASYFNIKTVDRIVWTPDNSGIWKPINIGKVNSQGIDLNFRSNITFLKKFSVGINLNYNYAEAIKKSEDFPGDPTYNKQLINLPQEYTKSSLFFDYKPNTGIMKLISFNIFYIFTGKRFDDLENTSFTPYYDLFNGNISVDLSLFKTITSFKLSINNLTNKNYEVLSGYPMPLRNYQFQIAIKY